MVADLKNIFFLPSVFFVLMWYLNVHRKSDSCLDVDGKQKSSN